MLKIRDNNFAIHDKSLIINAYPPLHEVVQACFDALDAEGL